MAGLLESERDRSVCALSGSSRQRECPGVPGLGLFQVNVPSEKGGL